MSNNKSNNIVLSNGTEREIDESIMEDIKEAKDASLLTYPENTYVFLKPYITWLKSKQKLKCTFNEYKDKELTTEIIDNITDSLENNTASESIVRRVSKYIFNKYSESRDLQEAMREYSNIYSIKKKKNEYEIDIRIPTNICIACSTITTSNLYHFIYRGIHEHWDKIKKESEHSPESESEANSETQ
jgi:CRISPR/Cas system CSM-associated protein Csm4 (group 5 of RAMP superfamily)